MYLEVNVSLKTGVVLLRNCSVQRNRAYALTITPISLRMAYALLVRRSVERNDRSVQGLIRG